MYFYAEKNIRATHNGFVSNCPYKFLGVSRHRKGVEDSTNEYVQFINSEFEQLTVYLVLDLMV